MDLSFVKTRWMIRRAVVGSILPLLVSPTILLPDMPVVVRVFWAMLLFHKLGAWVSFGFSGMTLNQEGIISFRRRFKLFDFHTTQISKIEFSELSLWVKLSYSGRNFYPAFTYLFMTFFIDNPDGEQLKFKVFVSTYNEDGIAIQAFLARLHELNPSLIIPDVQAFNATLK